MWRLRPERVTISALLTRHANRLGSEGVSSCTCIASSVYSLRISCRFSPGEGDQSKHE
jgi:hypothetical protein